MEDGLHAGRQCNVWVNVFLGMVFGLAWCGYWGRHRGRAGYSLLSRAQEVFGSMLCAECTVVSTASMEVFIRLLLSQDGCS